MVLQKGDYESTYDETNSKIQGGHKMTTKLLLRDSLSDDGSKITYMSYGSPDIITHSQVSHPKQFFTDNYATDCNEPMGVHNDNYIYLRVKNIGDQATQSIFVNLYVNALSLYLNPLNWQKNRIHTIRNNECSQIDSIAVGEIAVTEDYFVFRRETYNNSCFVAVASEEANPDFSWIDSWTKYTSWVTQNSNVAARNMVTYSEKEKRQYEEYINIINPYQQKAVFMITVSVNSKVPLNTTFGIESSALGINMSQKYVDDDSSSFIVTKTIVAGTDEYLRFYGALGASASSWPTDASISVQAILVQFELDPLKDQNIIQSAKIKTNRSAVYHFKENVCDGLLSDDGKTIKLKNLKNEGPVFGLRIGECGIRYI